MIECYYSHKKPNSDFHKLLNKKINKAYHRRKILTTEEHQKLDKLSGILGTLKRGENV